MKTNNSEPKPTKFAFRYIFYCTLSLILTFSACFNEEDDEPSLQGDKYGINDLSGMWSATEAFFSSLEIPHKGDLDVIDEGGSLTLKIESNGRFTITIVLPGEPNEVFTGKLGFDEEWLAISFDDDPGEYAYHYFDLNDDKTTLTIRGDGYLDLDDDGLEDIVSMNLVLSKN